jgi:hypothetical protein
VLREIDEMLRARGRLRPGGEGVRPAFMLAWIVAGGLLYGAVMGGYGLRPLQMAYSALKVPLLIGVSALVCLPNFLAVNTALGLRDDFATVLRAVVLAQSTVCVSLAALAPITVVAYVSVAAYDVAVLFNGAVFFVAALAGQVTLGRHYRPLIAANPRHRLGRNAWLALYLFVAIQMAWVLRPFVGNPDLPTRFFREGAWGNAYVEIAELIWRAISGS